jgi:tetratricopeptide (TPR) repeat protein/CHAT domain-containing protein
MKKTKTNNSSWIIFDKFAHYGLTALLGIVLVGESVIAITESTRVEVVQEQANSNEAIRVEGERLYNEGFQFFQQGTRESLKQALSKFKSALVLFRKVGDKKRQATIMLGIGHINDSLGYKQKALKYYNEALPVTHEVRNKSLEATTLNNIGLVYSDLGDKNQALKYYNQALPLTGEVRNKSLEATTLNNIGLVYSDLGDKQQALKYYNQALSLTREVRNKSLEATTLNNIGSVYYSLGDRQQALIFYNQALPLLRKFGSKSREAATLNNIGLVYYSLGDKQQALKFYNQALPLLRKVGYKSGEAITLNNIGSVYSDLGNKQQALKFYNQALTLRRDVGDKSGQATTLNNIGSVYSDLGDKQQALKFYNQALPLLRKVRNKSGEAITFTNLGNVYYSLGDKQQALKFYNQALPLSREVEDKSGEAKILNNIGLVYSDLGDKQQALKYYNEALPLTREVGDKTQEATTLSNIGNIYASLGEKQQALKLYNQALTLRRDIGDKSGQATTLNNIGFVYYSLGNKQQALKFYNQALTLMREAGDKSKEPKILSNIAFVHRDNGNIQAALTNSKAAIDIIENLRTKVDSNDLRTSYFATQQDTYNLHIDILMQLHKQNPSKGYEIQAFEASEKSRARGLLELLTEVNADIRKGANPEFIAQEKQLQQQIGSKENLRLNIVNDKNKNNDPISQSAVEMLEKEIQNHIFEYKQLKAKIKKSNPKYAALKYPDLILNLNKIQQQLDKDTVLLQYSLGKKRSYLWTVTPDYLDSYELPKQEEIKTAANKFKELLKKCAKRQNELGINCQNDLSAEQKAKDFQEIIQAATELSKLIFAPVSGKLGKKRLVIVADGALLEIPFAALSEPNQTNYQPLLVNRDIVNLPSVSAIAIHRSELKQRQTAPKTLAVLADAVFSNDDERVTGESPLAPEMDLGDLTLRKAAKNYNRAGWGRLKGTRTEAEEILKLMPSSQTLQAFDFDANYNWVTDKRLKQYRFIHLATHGFANPDNPELSGILLSVVDKNHKPYDRVNLLLGDIFNLDWGADLVVLSACETGLGKSVPGEGLIGLTRGLMYAGAEHAVISLWQVDDTATSKLIPQMYKAILEKNLSPAKALRQAQLQMWQQKEWRNPYYWAAFTSQGEWK